MKRVRIHDDFWNSYTELVRETVINRSSLFLMGESRAGRNGGMDSNDE